MKKIYQSNYYNYPIEIEKKFGEVIIKIFTKNKKEIIYSYYNIDEKTSYSLYIKNAILGTFIGNFPRNILILGFGAGAYAKYLKDYLGKKIKITGVEIDKTMIEIAKNEFNLKNINYINLDYLEAIKILKDKKFDKIFIDIYDKNSKIPNSLNNIKNISKITQLLSKNGNIIINFANYTEHKIFYKEIEKKLLNSLKNKYKINILNGKNDCGNIIGIYNLEQKINSKELILNYLSKVKKGKINYDPNLISKIFLKIL